MGHAQDQKDQIKEDPSGQIWDNSNIQITKDNNKL